MSEYDEYTPDTDSTTTVVEKPKVLVANNNENFINKKWRPMMAWTYMAVIISDFILFPILWSVLQATNSGLVTQQWDPITLGAGGLFHVAMGAVLGIAVYGRTREKLENKHS
jgi:hypothetical protein